MMPVFGTLVPQCAVPTLMLLALSAPAIAQPTFDRIALGPVEISLGDDQTRTLDKLRAQYSLSEKGTKDYPVGTSGVWNFSNRERTDSGQVTFENRKVVLVMRRWMPRQTAGAVSQAWVDALYRFMLDGRRQCEPFSPLRPGDDAVVTMGLRCGHSAISIWIGSTPSTVALVETLDDGR